MAFDLGIEGGTVVTSAGRARLHVYANGGRIAALTPDRQPANRTIDASGLLVMPGMVDAHVHFMDQAAPGREDFPTGTAAPARAGVKTVVEHTHAGPVRDAAELERKREYLRDRSRVDFGLAAHAWPDRLDEVEPLWRAGVAYMKVFTCTTHGVAGFDSARLLALFERAAACGSRLPGSLRRRRRSLQRPSVPCAKRDARTGARFLRGGTATPSSRRSPSLPFLPGGRARG